MTITVVLLGLVSLATAGCAGCLEAGRRGSSRVTRGLSPRAIHARIAF
jgi:hypothetical protein